MSHNGAIKITSKMQQCVGPLKDLPYFLSLNDHRVICKQDLTTVSLGFGKRCKTNADKDPSYGFVISKLHVESINIGDRLCVF